MTHLLGDSFAYLILCLIAQAVLILLKVLLRDKINTVVRVVLIALKIFLAILMGGLVMMVDAPIWWIAPACTAFYIALFADTASDVVCLIYDLIGARKNKSKRVRKWVACVLTAVFSLALVLYGADSVWNVTVNPVTYTSDKLTTQHKFAYVSDLHIGTAQPLGVSIEVIDTIKEQNVDFVILGGDVSDELTTKSEMKAYYSLFDDLGVPIYFTYGNHDRQMEADEVFGRTYTDEELEKAITGDNITIVHDEAVQLASDLVLVGREDSSQDDRADWEKIAIPDTNAFLLVADHQPNITNSGADLQLSGHIHAGQYWPLCAIGNLMGHEMYGWYSYADGKSVYLGAGESPDAAVEKGSTALYISSGVSAWAVPFKTEGGCHIEIVTLNPAN